VSCPSGYFEVRNEFGEVPIGKEECKVCEPPCLSCITTATTCQSCAQGKFFPEAWDDVENIDMYVLNSAGMAA
jgi:hypothetical protein